MYFYDRVQTGTFGTSLAVKSWTLAGFSDFNLHVHFTGQPNAFIKLLVYFDNLESINERSQLDAYGYLKILKTIPVYAPTMSIVLSGPTSPMLADLRIYACCCGNDATPRISIKSKAVDLGLLLPDYEVPLRQPKPKARPRQKPKAVKKR